MATFLDIGLFEHFGGLFTFLLVLVLMYAFLSKMVWKDNPWLPAIVAFIFAFFALMSPIAVKTLNLMAPWFVLFVIFGTFMILAFMSFGISEDHIGKILTSSDHGSQFYVWVLAIMLLIGVGSLVAVVNEEAPLVGLQAGGNASAAPTGSDEGFFPTLFNPKVLGMVLILLVAFFVVRDMTKK